MIVTHITNNFKSIYFSTSTFSFVLGFFKSISQDYTNTQYAEFTFEENKRNVCNQDKETNREREKTMTRRFHSWSTSWLSFQWNDFDRLVSPRGTAFSLSSLIIQGILWNSNLLFCIRRNLFLFILQNMKLNFANKYLVDF